MLRTATMGTDASAFLCQLLKWHMVAHKSFKWHVSVLLANTGMTETSASRHVNLSKKRKVAQTFLLF